MAMWTVTTMCPAGCYPMYAYRKSMHHLLILMCWHTIGFTW